jgi:hypothetical protein
MEATNMEDLQATLAAEEQESYEMAGEPIKHEAVLRASELRLIEQLRRLDPEEAYTFKDLVRRMSGERARARRMLTRH